jgi:orotidine-5'-phosphate decarboxylase
MNLRGESVRDASVRKNELCFGIDPLPTVGEESSLQIHSLQKFKESVQKHSYMLEMAREFAPEVKWLKPNLAFFLAYGSQGIEVLEQFVALHSSQFKIILDAKFSEISTSLQQQMKFCWQHLNVDAVTLNPFFGEESISTSFESIAKYCSRPAEKRIFVLCKTSQKSSKHLNYFQNEPEKIVQASLECAQKVLGALSSVGFVVGANELQGFGCNKVFDEIFESFPNSRGGLLSNTLQLLCPGVGAQGMQLETLGTANSFPCMFPLSRYLFEGGNVSESDFKNKIQKCLLQLKSHSGGEN